MLVDKILDDLEKRMLNDLNSNMEILYGRLMDIEIVNEDENREDGKYIKLLDEVRVDMNKLMKSIKIIY